MAMPTRKIQRDLNEKNRRDMHRHSKDGSTWFKILSNGISDFSKENFFAVKFTWRQLALGF